MATRGPPARASTRSPSRASSSSGPTRPSPHTSFSLASLLIGKYALSLSRLGLFTGHETIAEILRAYGYKTAGFFPPAIFYVDGERFKEYEQKHYGFEYVRFEPFKEDVDAPARTDQILSFLEAEKPARVFLWVHYFGPHEPYVDHPGPGAPPPFGATAMDRYDGEIRWVDGEVGRLVDGIRKQRPRSIIVVTADHGEEFGEHGGAYHGTSLHDEQLRVPFIVSLPDGTSARVGGMVSTIDIMPTLLSLVDVPVSTRVRGADLSPWMQAAAPPVTALPVAFAEVESQKMAAHGNEKLICDGERAYCRLFDLSLDPREVKDFAAERPERVAELKAAIGDWLGANGALERGPVGGGARTNDRRALLERVHLGDKEAIPGVVALLADGTVPASERLDGVRSLALLKDERARPGLQLAAGSTDPELAAWGNVGLAYLKDAHAAELCAKLDPALAKKDPLLLVHAALARAVAGDKKVAPALIEAFSAIEDVDLRRLVLHGAGPHARPDREGHALRRLSRANACATPPPRPFRASRPLDDPVPAGTPVADEGDLLERAQGPGAGPGGLRRSPPHPVAARRLRAVHRRRRHPGGGLGAGEAGRGQAGRGQ